MASHVPTYAAEPPLLDALKNARPRPGLETAFNVSRDDLVAVLKSLRDDHEYQQLMEIAGVDYPDRAERFEVVYCLLSLTKNHRVRVHVTTDETTALPSVTSLWPVAGVAAAARTGIWRYWLGMGIYFGWLAGTTARALGDSPGLAPGGYPEDLRSTPYASNSRHPRTGLSTERGPHSNRH